MSKIAVIKTGGKQYKVSAGKEYKFEKLAAEIGTKLKFDTLLIAEEDGSVVEVGKPDLGQKVEGEVISQGRAKKILVVKYKSKTRQLKRTGHKQPYTKVKITKIA